jgi:hypothetical protein
MLLLTCPEMLLCLWLVAVSCTQRVTACLLLNLATASAYSIWQLPLTAMYCLALLQVAAFVVPAQTTALMFSTMATVLAVYMLKTHVRSFCRICVRVMSCIMKLATKSVRVRTEAGALYS